MIMTSLCASTSFAFLCMGVATDYWIHIVEKKTTNTVNKTDYFEVTRTGLWRRCSYEESTPSKLNCSYISYFSNEEKDESQRTESIIYNLKTSTIFPLVSLLVLLGGGVVCFIGHCYHRKIALSFVAGILFVIAGLCTLMGIILFIGGISSETAHIPKPKKGERIEFDHYYGSSFMIVCASFALTELSGVLSVYLFINRYKYRNRKHKERVRMINSRMQPNNIHFNSGRRRSRSRSHDHSRDNSPTHSERTYFTYTTADRSRETSNYTLCRDILSPSSGLTGTSRSMDTFQLRPLNHSPSTDTNRRTTPV